MILISSFMLLNINTYIFNQLALLQFSSAHWAIYDNKFGSVWNFLFQIKQKINCISDMKSQTNLLLTIILCVVKKHVDRISVDWQYKRKKRLEPAAKLLRKIGFRSMLIVNYRRKWAKLKLKIGPCNAFFSYALIRHSRFVILLKDPIERQSRSTWAHGYTHI